VNGTVRDCAYFSIYQPQYMQDGTGQAVAVLDFFRLEAAKHGQCLHLALMVTDNGQQVDQFIKPVRMLWASVLGLLFLVVLPPCQFFLWQQWRQEFSRRSIW